MTQNPVVPIQPKIMPPEIAEAIKKAHAEHGDPAEILREAQTNTEKRQATKPPPVANLREVVSKQLLNILQGRESAPNGMVAYFVKRLGDVRLDRDMLSTRLAKAEAELEHLREAKLQLEGSYNAYVSDAEGALANILNEREDAEKAKNAAKEAEFEKRWKAEAEAEKEARARLKAKQGSDEKVVPPQGATSAEV